MEGREKFVHSVRKVAGYFFPKELPADESSSGLDREATISDLRLYLVQIARRIIDHLEYEHHVAQGLPRDTGLVFRFRLEDYVEELCEYFDRKGILGFEKNRDLLFTGVIEVLLPPENIREALPWRIRRKLFNTLLVKIAAQTGVSYPALTRDFYDHLTRGESVNGIARPRVIEFFQEALEELSREQEASAEPAPASGVENESSPDTPSPPPPPPEPPVQQLEIPDLIRRTFAACGATDYTTLKRTLSGRHLFDFLSAIVVYTIVGAAVLVFSDPLRSFFSEQLLLVANDVAWYILVAVIYLLLVVIRYQQFRLRLFRRRTLLRVSNAVAETMHVSYKEMDDVLYGTYGTTLRELKAVLLPKTRRK